MKAVLFTKDKAAEIVAFARQNSWCIAWPESLLHRFLSDLISAPNLVADFSHQSQRAAVAVLIDKISNPCNDASLEVLGLHSSVDEEELLKLLLPWAQAQLPTERSGFTFGFPASRDSLRKILEQHHLKPHYEMFEMLRPGGKVEGIHSEQYQRAEECDDKELFQALKLSFAQNVDTSIPPFEDWLEGRRRNPKRITWMQKEGDKIVAFLNLNLDDEVPEISTVGVLPEYRGKGHGKKLIQTALFFLGEKNCKLSVAVKNKKALELYLSLGFEVCDHHLVYRWRKN